MSDSAMIFWVISLYLLGAVVTFLYKHGFFIKDLFDVWEYGNCQGRIARRHKLNQNVQFITKDELRHKIYWYTFSFRYWRNFEVNKNLNKNCNWFEIPNES